MSPTGPSDRGHKGTGHPTGPLAPCHRCASASFCRTIWRSSSDLSRTVIVSVLIGVCGGRLNTRPGACSRAQVVKRWILWLPAIGSVTLYLKVIFFVPCRSGGRQRAVAQRLTPVVVLDGCCCLECPDAARHWPRMHQVISFWAGRPFGRACAGSCAQSCDACPPSALRSCSPIRHGPASPAEYSHRPPQSPECQRSENTNQAEKDKDPR